MFLKFYRSLSFFHLLVMAFAITLTGAKGQTSGAQSLSQLQKKEIELLIKEYILKHPEIILESVQRHQIKGETTKKKQAEKQLIELRPQLISDPQSPVSGNPKGDVTIVEFVDYRCGYCKRVHPAIKKLLKDDRAIRYVIKDFPILGPQSEIASRAALAIWHMFPEKHQAYHDEMMSIRGTIDEESVVSKAKMLGIDTKLLKKAMADKHIDSLLAKNFSLAKALNINGTPAFIIGDQIVPGAVDLSTLKKLVAEARKK